VVSAADRNLIAGLYRLYGAREYCGSGEGAAQMDGRIRIRPGAWIRIFIRAAANAAIRPDSHLLTSLLLFQRRRRAWTDSDARAVYSRVGAAFRYVVAERVGTIILSATRDAHRLALDDRARNCFNVSIAFNGPALKRWSTRARPCRLDDGTGDPGRNALAVIRATARPDRSRHRAPRCGLRYGPRRSPPIV